MSCHVLKSMQCHVSMYMYGSNPLLPRSRAAIEEAKIAGRKAEAAQAAIERAKEIEEAKAVKRARELEEEAKMTGVKGAAAFFKRAGEGSGDSTLTNKEKITQEAARRRELREANAALERAKLECEC